MITQIKDGGPAFPCEQHETPDGRWNQTFESGMALRDYFAAKALPATLQDYHAGLRNGEYGCDPDWAMGVAVDAYRLADAMLRAREVQS
jgi:hypothetical protein